MVISAPLSAERRMLGGAGQKARFSVVYGNNVLVGEWEQQHQHQQHQERGRVGGSVSGSGSVMGRKGTVMGPGGRRGGPLGRVSMAISASMGFVAGAAASGSPLPPVPKIPAAMVEGGGSGRESLISLHSTVNGPLPEYFSGAGGVEVGDSDNEAAGEAESRVSRSSAVGSMRRTHSVRNRSRSASRPGRIRARMPSTLSRASSRSSQGSSATPRSIKRGSSVRGGAGAGAGASVYASGEDEGTGTGGYGYRESPYMGSTPGTAPFQFDYEVFLSPRAPIQPSIPAPLLPPPPPQTPLPPIPGAEEPRKEGGRRKERKAKPARILLPQEIMAMEARRESRRSEMRMLAKQRETVMKPIMEKGELEENIHDGWVRKRYSHDDNDNDNDDDDDGDGFVTEEDDDSDDSNPEAPPPALSRNTLSVPPPSSSSSSAAALPPPNPALARKGTTRLSRKPVPASRAQVYSIFPTSPRRGSRGQLVYPPPLPPGTRSSNTSLRSPGMAIAVSPAAAVAATTQESPMKSLRRRRTARKSMIASPASKPPGFGFLGDEEHQAGLSFTRIPSFDFDFLPLGVALTPLRTPGADAPAAEGNFAAGTLGVGKKGGLEDAETVVERKIEKEKIAEEKQLTPILHRPRPKKPRPATRGKSAHRESLVHAYYTSSFFDEWEERNDNDEEEGDEEQQEQAAGKPITKIETLDFSNRRSSKYDSEIYALISPSCPSSTSSTSHSTPAMEVVELVDPDALSQVDSITRSSLHSLRESFYEELRMKYSVGTPGLDDSDLDSDEEEFVGGVLHMGTPPLDEDVDGESDEASSLDGSPPLPAPGTPLMPLRIRKASVSGTITVDAPVPAQVGQNMESVVGQREIPVMDIPELDSSPVNSAQSWENPAAARGSNSVSVVREATVRKPVPATSKPLPPPPAPAAIPAEKEISSPSSSWAPPPPTQVATRSASRATINPALESLETSYNPDPNEAFAALNIRTGDPFYSPTSQRPSHPAFPTGTRYTSPPPPRPAPLPPRQANMLPGMPKRRVELPRFTRTVRHSPPSVPPVKETHFFLNVKTPGSKTVYSSSPPLDQPESIPPTTTTTTPAPHSRPRATTHSGTRPQTNPHPPPPVPPIPRNISQGQRPLAPPPALPITLPLNRNSDPIASASGNEHVLSHYTPGTLITVHHPPPEMPRRTMIHRVDPPPPPPPQPPTHKHSVSARYTMKTRLEKALRLGSISISGGGGVMELGMGEYGGNWVDEEERERERERERESQREKEREVAKEKERREREREVVKEREREVKRHTSKPSLGGGWGRLKSGVFGGGGGGGGSGAAAGGQGYRD